MRQLLSTTLLLCLGFLSYGQVLITDADYTSAGQGECACSTTFNDGSIQNFFDSGGTGGNYGPNENDTITFCPDGTGTKMFVAFGINTGYTLDVDVSDTIFIFDGPDATYPPLDTLNSIITPNGIPATAASWSNTTGCLTIVFKSDGAVEGTGWDANVACGNLPQPFSAGMEAYINGEANGSGDLINDLNPADTGYVDVCFGDSIEFVATPYFPYEPGGDSASLNGAGYDQTGNHTLEWSFSDGTTVTGNNIWFTPPARNGYFVTLKITDSYGIFNYVSCKVRVSTIPSFATAQALEPEICLGQSTVLIGGVTLTDTAGVDGVPSTFPIGGVFAAQTYLPDGSGQNYTTTIDIAGFTPGGTITSATDIEQICVSIEHSYLGDLEMMLTCPNGTASVNVFNSYTGNGLYAGGFGGGGTFLGGAYDNNTGNIGVCEEYCFSNVAGAMPAWVNGYNTVASTGPSAPGAMVVPGTYEPEETFGNLAGCDINGTWTITIRDNLGIDDGYICEWGIYFTDSLNPNSEIYVADIVDEFWHSNPTIIQDLNNDTAIVILPDSVGFFGYTFEVLDSYGCSYDTTIIVEVIPGPSVIPSTTACLGGVADIVNTYAPLGGTWWVGGPNPATFIPNANVINPSISMPAPGEYTFYFTDNQCNDTVSTIITYYDLPIVDIWYEGSDTVTTISLCSDDQITLDVEGLYGTAYQWNSFAVSASPDSIEIDANTLYFPGSSTSTYEYIITATSPCGLDADTVDIMIEDCAIPNVITPNGDGRNEVFYTNFAVHYDDVQLTIYNRWGKVVYKTDSYDNTWHGQRKDSNQQVASGTYFYVMVWDGGTKDASGTVTVFDSK